MTTDEQLEIAINTLRHIRSNGVGPVRYVAEDALKSMDVSLTGCPHCDAGFPIANGNHYGTQSLGMIPSTPCEVK